jgi:hypothetical protein
MRWVPSDHISLRTIAVGITVSTLICSAPMVGAAYGTVPVTLVYGSSDTTGATTTAIRITQDDISQTRGYSGTALDDVNSQTQLVAYVASLMHHDSNIQSVELGDESVSMTYRSVITLQNFGERSVERTITVSKDGKVTETKPWYADILDTHTPVATVESNFADIVSIHNSPGAIPQTEALLLKRMQGRFQMGAL